METTQKKSTAARKKKPISNSPRVMAQLEKIKANKNRRLSKLGEWYMSDAPDKLHVEIYDMRAILR